MSAEDIKLPPLPAPDHHEAGTNRKLYIPDQMQAYARAAILADRASRAPSPQGDARAREDAERWRLLCNQSIQQATDRGLFIGDMRGPGRTVKCLLGQRAIEAIDTARGTPATEKGET